MRNNELSIEKLAQQLRVIHEKLEQSERQRADLADQQERDGQRYRQLHAALEAARREAEIEAALERVRARTMAMRRSDELAEASSIMFREITALGVPVLVCGFNIWMPEEPVTEYWMSRPDVGVLPPVRLDHTATPIYRHIFEASKRGEALYAETMEGEALAQHFNYVMTLPAFKGWLNTAMEAGYQLPESQVFHAAFFSQGYLMFITLAPCPEHWPVFERFARVFEQTYTRYQDLQQAEARAREAVRQASLDRVRAEIASMRTAADLQRITPLVWRELTTLGVPFLRCGVFIMDDKDRQMQAYLATPKGETFAALHLPYERTETTRSIVAHWHEQKVYTEQWDRDQFVAWTQAIREQGLLTSTDPYQGADAPPERLALQFVPFAQGMLYVGSREPLADDQIDVVQALADAFAVAYARYDDFRLLEAKNREVEEALHHLKQTQQQLIQAEKMASLGALTAGIAHEIKNPLNFINNFAEVNEELADELREALAEGKDVTDLLDDLEQNARVIAQHGKRADGIVRAMMAHARGGSGERERVDLNGLIDEYVDLAYHGKRAQTPGFNVSIERTFDARVGYVEVVPQDMGRVLLNLIGNAFDAVHEHTMVANGAYTPTVTVSTQRTNGQVAIRVSDNGPGIPEALRQKIFEPFFTTKPTGSGTGLGLSLSYDIVTRGHGGTLALETNNGEGTSFIVTLPVV